MGLNNLYIYGDVKITRDYSDVHDLSPSAWATYLKTQTSLHNETVNYYRLPSVIRIEGRYDDLRKARYGFLETTSDLPPGQTNKLTFARPFFFWVDEVRLIKEASYFAAQPPNFFMKDVVELVISPDVWSNNNGEFDLYDSWIVRRTCKRWNVKWQAGVKHTSPKYYAEGADRVEGAYELEGSVQDVTPGYTDPDDNVFDVRYIVVTSVDKDGKLSWRIGVEMLDENHQTVKLYNTPNSRFFTVSEIVDGTAFAAFHTDDNTFSVDDVQSVTVLPSLGPLTEIIEKNQSVYTFDQADVRFSNFFSASTASGMSWITLGTHTSVDDMYSSIYGLVTSTVTPVEPEWTDVSGGSTAEYTDKREPMLYRSPARIRKIVNGMGGSVVEIPDIAAFEDDWSCQNLLDAGAVTTAVYGDTDIQKANALGNIGMMENATLPIFSSAWKSYEATAKVADEIAYNAQQAATVANGLAGAAASGGMGAMAGGGPAGAILGAATALVGMGASVYSNSENLRAKQTRIRNSPAVVKSTGSGLGAAVRDFIDIHYETLKIDDVNYENLKKQYYYYGYNINAFEAGKVDLNVRHYFDYIETRRANVRGDLNASEALEIAAIFDKGVRIFHGTDGYARIGEGMGLENYEESVNADE